MQTDLKFPLTLLAAVAVVAACVAALLSNLVSFRDAPGPAPAAASRAGVLDAPVVYGPPRPEDAPGQLREAVVYGHALLTRTRQLVPDHVGNDLACTNCHFDGGRARDGISLVGVAATYPKFRTRTSYATHLVSRVNECFERSMNGKPLPPEGKEMQAIVAYLQWIARGIPVYAEVPWLGLRKVPASRAADPAVGQGAYSEKCAVCHGAAGGGTLLAPPLWGNRSYNDGAGMHRPENLASFARANMPKNAPDLTPEQAVDIAAFVAKQPRPRFTAGAKR